MFTWLRKDQPALGSVLFASSAPPRLEAFTGLAQHGVTAEPDDPAPNAHWQAALRHPRYGEATVVCLRDLPLPPREWVAWDPRLSQEERRIASGYRSALVVECQPRTRNVLSDRKDLLRFMATLLDQDGVVALDHTAQAFWSKTALDEELCHDADLDIAAIFTIHMVKVDGGERSYWLHTHGLKEIGGFDFDVLDPDPSCMREGHDALRSLAFRIVEGRIQPGRRFELVRPGGAVRLVPARQFQARGTDQGLTGWRRDVDDEHLDGHAIVCDPGRWRWFGLAADRSRASTFLSAPFPKEGLLAFSPEATAVMRERAVRTYPRFRLLFEELAEFGFPCLVKLGYVVDGGKDDDREHLWFEVHSCSDDEVEATLVNQPFHVARLKQGDRGQHSVGLLSDWTIPTPAGPISPRFSRALQELRSRREELRRLLRG